MKRLRIGVVGCGAIAQVHHLPNLAALDEQFEVTVVCDVSPLAAADAARRFHVPRHVTDWRDLLATDLDAVLLCHTDPKTEAAVATLDAGKHLFIEKPLCFSLAEIDAMIAAQCAAGTVAQAGYMKVYDPAFELAQRAVRDIDEIRFVQVNHLHPDNALHLRQFDIRRFDDYPADAVQRTGAARSAAVRDGDRRRLPRGAAHVRPAVRQRDPRPVWAARPAGRAERRGQHRVLARRPRRHLHAGVPERRALRRHLDRSARSVGLQGDAGGGTATTGACWFPIQPGSRAASCRRW